MATEFFISTLTADSHGHVLVASESAGKMGYSNFFSLGYPANCSFNGSLLEWKELKIWSSIQIGTVSAAV